MRSAGQGLARCGQRAVARGTREQVSARAQVVVEFGLDRVKKERDVLELVDADGRRAICRDEQGIPSCPSCSMIRDR